MVGTTLASALGSNSKLSEKKILLLEGAKESKWVAKPDYSNRVSALSPKTRNLMESIGIWKFIEEYRYGPVKKMHVWEALSDAMISFNEKDMSDPIAYIVENDLIIHAAKSVAEGFSNVTIVNEAKIEGYSLPKPHEDIVKVRMENGGVFTCNLLIGADGVGSKVRKMMGVNYVTWRYKQTGVVATLRLSEPGNNIVAWQRFLPTGPIAILPLSDQQSSLVWCTTPEHAATLLSLPINDFVTEINTALVKNYLQNSLVSSVTRSFDSILESFQFQTISRQLPPSFSTCDEKSRAAFPLGFGHSTTYVDKSVALIGDAAHRIHPLAGQGVNLGFCDVSTLNSLLGEAVSNGQFIGSLVHLKKYESECQRHNVPLMLGVDGIQKLTGTDWAPVVLLRSLGFQAVHAISPLKNFFKDYATR